MLVVVVVVVGVVVVAGVVVVVVFAVVTCCGRSYASKQREEVGGTYWGGREGFLPRPHAHEAAAAGAELVTDFSVRLQLVHQED